MTNIIRALVYVPSFLFSSFFIYLCISSTPYSYAEKAYTDNNDRDQEMMSFSISSYFNCVSSPPAEKNEYLTSSLFPLPHGNSFQQNVVTTVGPLGTTDISHSHFE